MAFAKDLIGRRFGKLIVVSRNYGKQKEVYNHTNRYAAYWNCRCDCGNTVVVSSSNLQNKTNPTTSCGCHKKFISHKQKNTKENEWIFDGDVVIGITSAGDKFLIDKEDFDKVKNYCWRREKRGYIIANSRNGENKIVWIHRIIMSVTDEQILVDHKSWDKSDNRKTNLRLATKSQNNINIKRKSNNTSGYTGVTYNKRSNKYIARISKDNKRIFLGSFDSIEEAIKARHEAEISLHGEWSGEYNRNDFLIL